MADYSLQDFWWNKPSRTESQLPALQLGVQIVQRKAQEDLQNRQLADELARTEIARAESIAKLQLQTSISAASAELAGLAAKITDFSDPAQMKPIYDLGSRAGHVVGTKGWDGIINTHERAVMAKQRSESAQSVIDERNRRADMAGNMGWVYPEDGSPPYLVDAKGGTHFAPFHAGLEAGFTPEKTNVGGVDLIHVSPNKWQVVNRPVPEGKLTDLEREDLRFVRKRRQELVDGLPDEIPKTGMFGGNKEKVDKYNATTNEIATLTAKEEAIHKSVETRSNPSEVAPKPKVEREGLQTAPKVGGSDAAIRRQGGNMFQQQPDGTWKFIGPAQ